MTEFSNISSTSNAARIAAYESTSRVNTPHYFSSPLFREMISAAVYTPPRLFPSNYAVRINDRAVLPSKPTVEHRLTGMRLLGTERVEVSLKYLIYFPLLVPFNILVFVNNLFKGRIFIIFYD